MLSCVQWVWAGAICRAGTCTGICSALRKEQCLFLSGVLSFNNVQIVNVNNNACSNFRTISLLQADFLFCEVFQSRCCLCPCSCYRWIRGGTQTLVTAAERW